jgi:hypothetical protein
METFKLKHGATVKAKWLKEPAFMPISTTVGAWMLHGIMQGAN